MCSGVVGLWQTLPTVGRMSAMIFPSPGPRPGGRLSTIPATLLLLVLVAAATLLTTPSARAHDTLIEASPGQDAVVEEPPTQVALTFSAELLDLPTRIVVAAGDGAVVAEGAAVLDGQAARLPLPTGLPNGDYDVTWSVVSSDGHRTEDTYTFTLAAADNAAPAESAVESAAPAPRPSAQAPEAGPAPETNADRAQERGDDGWMPSWTTILLVQAGIMVFAVVAALGYKRWRTR